MTYYKILHPDNSSVYEGYKWPEIGEWTDYVDYIEPCESGYHATTLDSLNYWADSENGAYLYELEFDGDVIRSSESADRYGDVDAAFEEKVVGHRARLTKFLGIITPDCIGDCFAFLFENLEQPKERINEPV